MGVSASPTLVDIDGDGDLDALSGRSAGETIFFRNTGTASAPPFAAGSTHPFGLNDVGVAASPAFADVDGDADLDAFVGERYGETVSYWNVGTALTPTFVTPALAQAKVSFLASPTLVDIESDADLDALVGSGELSVPGPIVFFENTGTASAAAFAAPSTNPFGLDSVPGFSSPDLVDIDGDGDLDAFIGDRYGSYAYGAWSSSRTRGRRARRPSPNPPRARSAS